MGLSNPQRCNRVEVVTGMVRVFPCENAQCKRYIDYLKKKSFSCGALLYFACREVNAKEHKFKMLRECRTAVRAQMGTASGTWCYGHMALPYLHLPIREESITAWSRYETGAFVQKNIVQAQLEKSWGKQALCSVSHGFECVIWISLWHCDGCIVWNSNLLLWITVPTYSQAFWLVTNKFRAKVLFLYVTWTEYLSLLHEPTIFSVHLSFQHSVKLLP